MNKKGSAPPVFKILFFGVLGFLSSCASLPPEPGAAAGEALPSEPQESGEYVPVDPPGTVEEALEEDTAEEPEQEAEPEQPEEEDEPDIWKRAEELLAYLDKPVNPDLPEPEYVPPDSAEDLTEPEEAAVDLAE
ncbi:MAG: hypothetical protein LBB98_07185, partial [Treponema sp.]|nr:hypothetical protein [Treponema sp.]